MDIIAWKVLGVVVLTLLMGILIGIPIGMDIILRSWERYKGGKG